mmetsp:Transcript_56518/g.128157  ORF Transcript_56518/g.128157 Transcript_56518/m.128157 type:complete len:755 (+) Transcript_56518:129-2393(+)
MPRSCAVAATVLAVALKSVRSVGAEEEEETEEIPVLTWASSIFFIILALVVLTIAFDLGQDFVLESAIKQMRPVVRQLFAEMTILGFLSICTFIATNSGLLEDLSEIVMGDEESLIELIEKIHYTLFMVMVIFIAEVLGLLSLGNSLVKKWKQLNEVSIKLAGACDVDAEVRLGSKLPPHVEGQTVLRPAGGKAWQAALGKDKLPENITAREALLFWGMRREFILDRNVLPPHRPTPPNKRISRDFEYSNYLECALSRDLTEIVHVEANTWITVVCLAGTWSLLLIPLWEHTFWFCLLWVVCSYGTLLFCAWALNHVRGIELDLIDPKAAAALKVLARGGTISEAAHEFQSETTARPASPETGLKQKSPTVPPEWEKKSSFEPLQERVGGASMMVDHETRNIIFPDQEQEAEKMDEETDAGAEDVGGYISPGHLPAWAIKPDVPTEKRGPLMRFLFGRAPNKFHRLFVFQENGHDSHIYICRLLLVFQAIYLSILIAFVAPEAERLGHHPALFLVFGILPLLIFPALAGPMVRIACHVGAVGSYRDKSLVKSIVDGAQRKKMAKLLLTLNSVRKQMSHAKTKVATLNADMPQLPADEIASIERVFDLYDDNKTGELNHDELKGLMRSLGSEFPSDPEEEAAEVAALLQVLDEDNSGSISKQEFIAWSIASRSETLAGSNDTETDLHVDEVAKEIFDMFDEDKTGKITMKELHDGFVKFGVRVSDEDFAVLARALDKDESGDVDLKEFEGVLKMR